MHTCAAYFNCVSIKKHLTENICIYSWFGDQQPNKVAENWAIDAQFEIRFHEPSILMDCLCLFPFGWKMKKKYLMNPKQRAGFSLLKNMALFFLVNSFQRWSFDKVSDCKYIEKAWYKSHIHHPDVIGIIYSMTV